MKYLLLVAVFLMSCEIEVKTETDDYDVVIEKVLQFEPLPLPELRHNTSNNYNGNIDYIDDNSWVYTSHLNSLCTDAVDPVAVLKSPCRKVNTLFEDEVATDRIVKTKQVFSVLDINLEDPPYWVIVWQDWNLNNPETFDIYPDSHPMTTLKVKVFDGKLYLAHYDNSWQWGYDHSANFGNEVDHDLHQENRLNGLYEIEIGVEYNVEIINYDSGRFIFKVNDVVISDVMYQTKSPTDNHVEQWGIYYSKGYNVDNDPLKRIVISISDFTMSVAHR